MGASPALFCFLVMRPDGYEPGLVRSQFERRAGIFACDDFSVFCDGGQVHLGDGPGGSISSDAHHVPELRDGKGSWGSWLNTLTFQNVWDELLRSSRYRAADWVLKADPDAVFLPPRLRGVLKDLTNGQGLYIRNCNQPNHIAMQGSIEIFSRKAIETYGEQVQRCKGELNWHGWGEDSYMQHCMEHLGMGGVQKFDLMSDVNCAQFPCTDTSRVSFHAFKTENGWWDCWRQ